MIRFLKKLDCKEHNTGLAKTCHLLTTPTLHHQYTKAYLVGGGGGHWTGWLAIPHLAEAKKKRGEDCEY